VIAKFIQRIKNASLPSDFLDRVAVIPQEGEEFATPGIVHPKVRKDPHGSDGTVSTCVV